MKALFEIRDRGLPIIGTVGDLDCSIIEDDVHRCAFGFDFIQHRHDFPVVGQLSLNGVDLDAECPDLLLHLSGMLLVAAVQDQVASLLGHKHRRLITYSAAGSGNERPFSFHIDHSDILPVCDSSTLMS
ncbi:hypothetical protein D3C74_241920 [compost metagenome]